MTGMMSMGRVLVANVEAFDKAINAVGKSRLFNGKLLPLLKDYVASAVQLDEAVDRIVKAREEADTCFIRVDAIKEAYRQMAQKAARTDSAMVADIPAS